MISLALFEIAPDQLLSSAVTVLLLLGLFLWALLLDFLLHLRKRPPVPAVRVQVERRKSGW